MVVERKSGVQLYGSKGGGVDVSCVVHEEDTESCRVSNVKSRHARHKNLLDCLEDSVVCFVLSRYHRPIEGH